MTASNDQIVTILLDIKEQQGVFSAQMIAAQHSRERMEKDIGAVKAKVEKIEPVVEVVADMKPKVEELIAFRNRAAGVVVVASFIVTGALTLIYAGLKEIGPAVGRVVTKALS